MPTPERLPTREKLAFACGDFASCIYWTAFSSFLLIFYTDVFGISGRAAGTMLLASRIFDGINDPVIGAIADRTHTRWGNFRPYLLWCCVPFAIAGVLCFTTPDFDASNKLLWAWITYNLLMVIYTAINIPYNSMLGVITADPIERTSVASYKFFFAFGAGLFVKFTLPFLTRWLGDNGFNPQKGYQLTFVLYGVIAVACFLIAFAGTKERVRPPQKKRTPVGRDLLDLVTNGPWLILSVATVGFVLFSATRDTISPYYIKYYVGSREISLPFLGTRTYGYEVMVSVYLGLGAFASLVGVLFSSYLAGKLGKKTTFVVCLSFAAVIQGLYFFLRSDQVFAMLTLQFVGTLISGPLAVLLWAMYADTADYWDWKRGRRATGLVFSASTMTQKFAWAVCGKAAGDMLSLTGFVANATQQTPGTLRGMIHMMSTVSAFFGLLAVVTIFFFPLNERKMGEIEIELKARRARSAADSVDPAGLPAF